MGDAIGPDTMTRGSQPIAGSGGAPTLGSSVAAPGALTQSHEPARKPAGSDAKAASIRRRAAGGAAWIFLAFAVLKVLGFANNVILARLLAPEQFGLVGFAMVVVGVFKLLQDLGVPAALIYSKRDINVVGGTALTINMAAAALLVTIMIAASPFLARLGGDPVIGEVAAVLSLGLLFTAAGSVQRALLMKELAFRRKFLPDVVAVILEGIVAATLALLGFGVWSLVAGYLTLTLTETLLLWLVSPIRPAPRFDRAIARDLVGYGKHVSFSSVLGSSANNVDYLIIGASLGSFSLGIYTMAFLIAGLPHSAISQVVKTAMFPAYSRLRDDITGLTRLFEDVFTLVWSFSIAAGLVIFIAGPPYMSMLLGPEWNSIEEPLRILAIYGVVRSIGAVFSPAYMALGRPQTDWWFTSLRLALVVPLMLFMVRFGVNGVASVHVIVFGILVPANAIVFSRVSGISTARLLRLVAPQAAGVGGAAVVLLGIAVMPGLAPLESSLLGPFIVTVVCLSIYAAVVLYFHRSVLAHVQRLLVRLRRRHAMTPAT